MTNSYFAELEKDDNEKIVIFLYSLKCAGWLFDDEIEPILTRVNIAVPPVIPEPSKGPFGSEALILMVRALGNAEVLTAMECQEIWDSRMDVYDYHNMPKAKRWWRFWD